MNETVRALIVPADHLPDQSCERLVAAGITAPTIQEPAPIDPRRPPAWDERHDGDGHSDPAHPEPNRQVAGISVLNAVVALEQPLPVTAPQRVAQHRATQPMPPHAAPGDGLRLIPLSGFHWGGALRGRNMPPAPRVRGDHVLILLKGGVLQIEFPRNRQLLVPGRVAFIPAGTAFALNPGADVQGCALLLAPGHGRDLPMPLPPGCRFGAPAIEDAALIEPAMQALGAAQPRTSAGQAATACQMALIAVALSRLDERAGVYGPRQSGILEARPLTERFLELAEAELSQNQTIAELARRLGHSLAHLDRACLQSRGRSALQLLYDLRLERAARALRGSDIPICDIAQELGYAGLGHFMRSFAAATGRSPEAYRDVMRNGVGGRLD